eukprot:2073993-Amphidinium_carterae.1
MSRLVANAPAKPRVKARQKRKRNAMEKGRIPRSEELRLPPPSQTPTGQTLISSLARMIMTIPVLSRVYLVNRQFFFLVRATLPSRCITQSKM